jgi:hypothetical protein
MLDEDRPMVIAGAGSGFTVTEPLPEDVVYAAELAESGVYVALSESVPVASDPAGTLIVAEPLLSAVAVDV